MKHLWNFCTGLLVCTLFLMACTHSTADPALSDPGLTDNVERVSFSLFDIVRLIFATFGGVATTILLTYLKNRYPKYFGSLKTDTESKI